jgi:chromosome segregation ATPase
MCHPSLVIWKGKSGMKRKKTDIVQLSKIRMREELRQKLVRDAERGAKTLNSEIVERLEKSYEKDERIKALQERLQEIRQAHEETRAAILQDRDRLFEESAQYGQDIIRFREEARRSIQEYNEELKGLEKEVKKYETAAGIVDALLGDDAATKKAVRSVALLLADTPGWSASPDSIHKITEGISAAIKVAAEEEQ